MNTERNDFAVNVHRSQLNVLFDLAAALVEDGGVVEASGAGAIVTFNDGASIAAGAEVESSGSGATVNFFSVGTVDDSGTILAANNGAIQFDVSDIGSHIQRLSLEWL